MTKRLALAFLLSLGGVVAHAQGTSDPRAAAQSAISSGPDRYLCPLVTAATRLSDGSIRATCNNGESFVVLNRNGQTLAMRCAVARREGIVC